MTTAVIVQNAVPNSACIGVYYQPIDPAGVPIGEAVPFTTLSQGQSSVAYVSARQRLLIIELPLPGGDSGGATAAGCAA